MDHVPNVEIVEIETKFHLQELDFKLEFWDENLQNWPQCGGGGAHYEDDYDSEDDDDGRPPNCGRRKSVGLSLQWCKEQVFVVHKMLKESKFSSSSFVVVVVG